jgi:hypothetical protein
MNRGLVLGVAGGLAALWMALFGWRYVFGPGGPAPAKLAQQALSAGEAEARAAAAFALAQAGDDGQEQMIAVLKESKDPAVRAIVIRGLESNYCYDAMPVLLDTLDDRDPQVFIRAAAAVQRLLGQHVALSKDDVGFRVEDPPEKRRQKIEKAREYWENLRVAPRLQRWKNHRAGQERR